VSAHVIVHFEICTVFPPDFFKPHYIGVAVAAPQSGKLQNAVHRHPQQNAIEYRAVNRTALRPKRSISDANEGIQLLVAALIFARASSPGPGRGALARHSDTLQPNWVRNQRENALRAEKPSNSASDASGRSRLSM
jgi:hypothetical protein